MILVTSSVDVVLKYKNAMKIKDPVWRGQNMSSAMSHNLCETSEAKEQNVAKCLIHLPLFFVK